QTISPDGSLNASKIVENSSNTFHLISKLTSSTTTANNCENTIQTGISAGQIELNVNAVVNIEIKKTAVIIFLPFHNALR
ncbi:MAG: hypothetical protein ACPGCR_02800, partial [Acholeplasmataceae bacterium]